MYHAKIDYTATPNSYENGEIGYPVNIWHEELTAETSTELREKVLTATYSKWEDVSEEQINEYQDCTEYAANYMTDDENQVEATASQLEKFKAGTLDLYLVDCHIRVFETTNTKATL